MTATPPTTPRAQRPPLSPKRYALFASIVVALSLVIALVVLLAADLYLHRRAERSAGLNSWGYRGKTVGRKAANEVRIGFLGGSTMFGYGVTWDKAIPALVEQNLSTAAAPVGSVNLGLNNEGAFSFLYTLQDYERLNLDVVVLYEGYNDLRGDENGGNTSLFRHESAVFRLTGYYPILPLVLEERAMLYRYGDLGRAYAVKRGEAPAAVFQPGLAGRSAATALEAANAVGESMARGIGSLSTEVPRRVDNRTEAGCAPPWSMYCQSIYRAAQFALARGQMVAIGSQPTATEGLLDLHLAQQAALVDMIQRHFAQNARVIHADLRNAVDLHDRNLSFDEMHLTEAGNVIAAGRMAELLEPLVEVVRANRQRQTQ